VGSERWAQGPPCASPAALSQPCALRAGLFPEDADPICLLSVPTFFRAGLLTLEACVLGAARLVFPLKASRRMPSLCTFPGNALSGGPTSRSHISRLKAQYRFRAVGAGPARRKPVGPKRKRAPSQTQRATSDPVPKSTSITTPTGSCYSGDATRSSLADRYSGELPFLPNGSNIRTPLRLERWALPEENPRERAECGQLPRSLEREDQPRRIQPVSLQCEQPGTGRM
jgi:hypothetical protein